MTAKTAERAPKRRQGCWVECQEELHFFAGYGGHAVLRLLVIFAALTVQLGEAADLDHLGLAPATVALRAPVATQNGALNAPCADAKSHDHAGCGSPAMLSENRMPAEPDLHPHYPPPRPIRLASVDSGQLLRPPISRV